MALLITCFIIALFIYFAFYYEKDKKAMEQRRKTRTRRNGEDYIIFPFLEDNRDGSEKDISGTSEEFDDIFYEDH